MHVLLIAPAAPPKNSAEAIQVGRFLAALDSAVRVTLVTTPVVRGWIWEDKSLAINRRGLRAITLGLPLHRLTQRLLSNRHLAPLHVPDTDFWLPWHAKRVLRKLEGVPDVIYSRSTPFSAALLAQRLKRLLDRPWMMHLSDPWAANPYRRLPASRASADSRLEAACILEADLITLTTEGQAAHYRARFPERAAAIRVAPNMMPRRLPASIPPEVGTGPFRLVYTGALYGSREPSTLLAALHLLGQRAPQEFSAISAEFYGNMSPEIAAAIEATPGCSYHGTVSYEEAGVAQANANALLTIEPSGDHPLMPHFLPSKNLDYVARRKPILAITPPDSETTRLCAAGHGWAVAPGDVAGLADRLSALARSFRRGEALLPLAPDPCQSPYRAELVGASILDALRSITAPASRMKVGSQ